MLVLVGKEALQHEKKIGGKGELGKQITNDCAMDDLV